MATRDQIETTYNYMDRLWRASLGDDADITCAFFEGDFSKTLEQAQCDKHELMLSLCRVEAGQRVLDIGCGWGGFLRELRRRGIAGKGLTLSSRQAAACVAAELDVQVCDWRNFTETCPFDAIVSVGAFEHFASKADCLAGEAISVYRRFFDRCHHLLKPSGRLFLQTMTWGISAPKPDTVSIDAPRSSDSYIVAVLEHFYPGSWLPTSIEQIRTAASPYFNVSWVSNGRRDYIETMARWRDKIFEWNINKILPAVALLLRATTDRDMRYRLETLRHGYNRECFRRGIMDHYRIVFEAI